MLFTPRISLKRLAGLCRRLGIALEAGIDVRTAWAREADRARGTLHKQLLIIKQGVDQGHSLADAIAETGDYFPPLFFEMIRLAEETGHLGKVMSQLADNYEQQLSVRRNFWSAISWPLMELALALLIVGFLIWIMGFIRESTPGQQGVDILGLGLAGEAGLVKYFTFLAIVGAAIWLFVYAIKQGLFWVGPIQKLMLKIPVLGGALQTLALARLSWSMNVTMNAGMDLRRALTLSLRSTQNARYIDDIPVIDKEILAGNTIEGAFRSAGGYPLDFLDAIAVGEQSGKVVESMGSLSRQYQEQSRGALSVITMIAGWLVWVCIAGVIIMVIFRIFNFYLGQIKNVLPS